MDQEDMSMAYVWEKEKIGIELNGKRIGKEFLPLEVIDFPVEYVSEDGEIYLLLLMDDEDKGGEWWYVVETNSEVVQEYLEGKRSVRDIFDSGKVYVGFRSYEGEEDVLENLEPLKKKIEERFIEEDELPTYRAGIEIDEETLKEIKPLMRSVISEESTILNSQEFTNIEFQELEAEVSMAA